MTLQVRILPDAPYNSGMTYRETRSIISRCQFFQVKMHVRWHHLGCVGMRRRLLYLWDAFF